MNDDLEQKKKSKLLPEKATNAVKFLEGVAYFTCNNDGIVLDDAGDEVVSITNAIRAVQMAELQALEWAKTINAVESDYRIKQLKQFI